MPTSRKSSNLKKPRKPGEPLKTDYYVRKTINNIPYSTSLSDIVKILNKIEKPEECRIEHMYSNIHITRYVLDEVLYNKALDKYNNEMKKYDEKMKEYVEKFREMENKEEKEKLKKKEEKIFENLDNTGKRFSLLEFD